MSTASNWRPERKAFNGGTVPFGYRDSIFKHEYQDRYVIVAVGLRLSKNWQPVLTYGDLTRLDPATVTARDVLIPFAICG
jgi:UDP-N-acetylmuramate dehydrogenase